MLEKKECPFCSAVIGVCYPKDTSWVNHWMGKHLAMYHKEEMERVLYKLHTDIPYTPQVQTGKVKGFKRGL